MSSWIPSLFDPPSDGDKPTTSSTPKSPSSGVKEDLTAVFRGVAAFLAPPPPAASSDSSSSDAISGIKNDLAEIEGSFRSGLNLLSSKLNSNFLQFQSRENDGDGDDEDRDSDEEDVEEDDDIVGINEEIVAFVRKISGRPELWTDFPLSSADDFNLSDYQREHAAGIGHLVPELVTLRQKLSSQISNGKFWLIYFILLFPWLDEEELKLLSTPQVVEARQTLLNKLQDKTDVDKETSENLQPSVSDEGSAKGYSKEGSQNTSQSKDAVAESLNATKQKNVINETVTSENFESSVADEGAAKGYSKEGGQNTSQNKDAAADSLNATKQKNIPNETETGHHAEVVNTTSIDAPNQSENEDVSFSDLEDDDNDLPQPKGSKIDKGESRQGIQVNETPGAANDKQQAGRSGLREMESEGEESNDWLTVDDTDFDSLAEI